MFSLNSRGLKFIIRIKHDFPFINIRKYPRELLKIEGVARGFQPSRGALRIVMNDRIMFDRFYCINSGKHCEMKKTLAHYILYPHHNFLREYAFKNHA